MKGLRCRFAEWLHRLADRVDDCHARKVAGGLSFTFERGEGIRFWTWDSPGRLIGKRQRGCPIAYLSAADYQRAHDEAVSR